MRNTQYDLYVLVVEASNTAADLRLDQTIIVFLLRLANRLNRRWKLGQEDLTQRT